MRNDTAWQLALRSRARSLSVCTTGSISLAASDTGGEGGRSAFIRTTGSFITDGLAVGMEISASGFISNNGPATIEHLSDLVCTVKKTLTSESANAGRVLAVGLPSIRVWENLDSELSGTPKAGEPYVVETYLPGPSTVITVGPNGEIECDPMYVLRIVVPAGASLVASRYTDAIGRHFPPRLALSITGGDVLRVRHDTAPTPGQLLDEKPGFKSKEFSIPCRIRTFNLI